MRAIITADVEGVHARITAGYITPARLDGSDGDELPVMPVSEHEAEVERLRDFAGEIYSLSRSLRVGWDLPRDVVRGLEQIERLAQGERL